MLLALDAGRDRAGRLIGDVCTRQLGRAGVDLAVQDCDGDSLPGVALRARLVEVVVREIGLVGGCDGVRRMGRAGG